MKAQKRILTPNNGRKLKEPTTYPESETDQKATLSIQEMFERYNQDPDKMDQNYFDASEVPRLRKFLRPNVDLTDLDELQQFNKNMTKSLKDAYKKQKAEQAKNTDHGQSDKKPVPDQKSENPKDASEPKQED